MTNHPAESKGLAKLSAALGIHIPSELLELALTHRSFAFENGGIPHNERLEFLGDAILGQVVTVMLYKENPDLAEGELAKRRASLVSASALSEVARKIDLGDFIRLGKGEEQTGGRSKTSILADCVEALIGAVYLASDQEETTKFVLQLIEPLLDDPGRFGVAMDPKTSLQELSAGRGLGLPVYQITESGPDHSKSFVAEVFVGKEPVATGTGSSKKQAEMAAALEAWNRLTVKYAQDPEQES